MNTELTAEMQEELRLQQEILDTNNMVKLDLMIERAIYKRDDSYFKLSPPAPYSKDIFFAWKVVDKMREKFHWKLYSGYTNRGINVFCEFWDHAQPVNHSGSANDVTAPLAICRAALLAVRETK